MTEQLPTGDEFLPKITTDELMALNQKESNPKAIKRMLVYISRKEGLSISNIAKKHNLPYSTARDWLVRSQNNLDRLYDSKIPGRPRRLGKEQLAELKQDLHEGPQAHGYLSNVWTARMAVDHVAKKYGVQYKARHMQNIMHELELSFKTPRPRHPKAATPVEAEDFKKRTNERGTVLKKDGYETFAGDACAFVINWTRQKGWFPKNGKATVPITLSRQRFTVLGILGSGTLL